MEMSSGYFVVKNNWLSQLPLNLFTVSVMRVPSREIKEILLCALSMRFDL